MANFTVESKLLRSHGERIRDISNNTLSRTIISLDSVKSGIEKVSPDLIQTMDLLIERAKKHQAVVDGLGQAAVEIGRRYEIADMEIINYNKASDNVGTQNGNVNGEESGARLDSHRKEDESLWDKLKLFAKVFGMSFVEVLHLFGDIIQLLGAGGLEAVTGWIDGYDWQEWAYQYVPNHVDDQTLLAILTLMTINTLSPEASQENFENNMVAWEEYLSTHPDDYYIEHQGDMRDREDINTPGTIIQGIHYGKHQAYYNACEVIAVYNALLAMNDGNSPESFPGLLYTFEQNGICAGGDFGTSPMALYVYFEENGYEAEMLSGGQINNSKLDDMQEEYDTYIFTAYNDGNDLGEMIHTVSITAETIDGETKYQVHNASDDTAYDSLAEAVAGYKDGEGEPISIIGVR